jgi:hypothetical protein
LIGGCDVAKRIILEAIVAGKHVVTANKACSPYTEKKYLLRLPARAST